MRATASLSFEDGIATSSWNAMFALRTRVSMSAIGSVIVIELPPPSPRALRHAGDLACMRHVPQTDSAQTEVAVHRTRAAATAATRVGAHLELGLALLLVDQRFLCHLQLPLAFAAEREAQRTQERAAVLVGVGGGDDRDVHPSDAV